MNVMAVPFFVLALAPTPAADPVPSPLAGIADVAVFVEPLAPEVETQGITSGVIGAEVVARLLEAGLSVPNIDATILDPKAPTLHVDILTLAQEGVDQVIYSIRIEFTQTVKLERDPDVVVHRVPTWSVSGVAVGTREWRQAMITDVLSYTDEFVAAFQAANPPADNGGK